MPTSFRHEPISAFLSKCNQLVSCYRAHLSICKLAHASNIICLAVKNRGCQSGRVEHRNIRLNMTYHRIPFLTAIAISLSPISASFLASLTGAEFDHNVLVELTEWYMKRGNAARKFRSLAENSHSTRHRTVAAYTLNIMWLVSLLLCFFRQAPCRLLGDL